MLRAFVHPVEPTLEAISARFAEMAAARRGGLTILRGDTGAGKSTFLDTVHLFRDGVVTERIPGDVEVSEMLAALGGSGEGPRIMVLDGREALGTESTDSIEAALHAVNEFVRSDAGAITLVVWPTNTDDLTQILSEIGQRIGGEALFGVGNPVEHFSGPPKDQYAEIAEKTVQTLNSGASLAALGISDDHASELAEQAVTVGHYMGLVREALLQNEAFVGGLLTVEHYRLWTLVIAGNEPENDVAAVTRGSHGLADIDRLLSATNANVVTELKQVPEKVGLLATNLDARILHMDMLTALAIAREQGDERLHELMRGRGMSTTPTPGRDARSRLEASELGTLLAANALGLRRRGSKPGGGTKNAFESLAEIASTDDAAINRSIGAALKEASLVEHYEDEVALGTELVYTSDLRLQRNAEPIRLEVMWRTKTSRAGIANYVLGKLRNYGRAIGYLD